MRAGQSAGTLGNEISPGDRRRKRQSQAVRRRTGTCESYAAPTCYCAPFFAEIKQLEHRSRPPAVPVPFVAARQCLSLIHERLGPGIGGLTWVKEEAPVDRRRSSRRAGALGSNLGEEYLRGWKRNDEHRCRTVGNRGRIVRERESELQGQEIGGQPSWTFAVAADQLSFISENNQLRRASIRNSQFENEEVVPIPITAGDSVTVSPDGKKLPLRKIDGDSQIWDLTAPVPTAGGKFRTSQFNRFSINGQLLASSQTKVDLFRIDGIEAVRVGS